MGLEFLSFLCQKQARMPAICLSTLRVEKPWGRRTLGHGFVDCVAQDPPIGEIWFEAPAGMAAELMIKYLFTSERLSVQVHPNDVQARAAGHAHGKEEAWIILEAEPGATIAIGPKRSVSREEWRVAALDGSIIDLLDWKPVKAGDAIYLEAGTVHAIGGEIVLIEIQQNIDLTYRFYDYGRPRPLHLEESVAVARGEPVSVPNVPDDGRLLSSGKFSVDRWKGAYNQVLKGPAWLVPIKGAGHIDGMDWQGGQCWFVNGDAQLTCGPECELLIARITRD